MSNKFESVFGKTSSLHQQAQDEKKKEREEMLKRKSESSFLCQIPDWTGQGGVLEFWINKDGTFESEDTRLSSEDIKDGIRKFANDWTY